MYLWYFMVFSRYYWKYMALITLKHKSLVLVQPWSWSVNHGTNPVPRHSSWTCKLKADRLHPRDYPHTPNNYRHTDKHLRLVSGSAGRVVTDGQTDGGRTGATKYIISLASRLIMIVFYERVYLQLVTYPICDLFSVSISYDWDIHEGNRWHDESSGIIYLHIGINNMLVVSW